VNIVGTEFVAVVGTVMIVDAVAAEQDVTAVAEFELGAAIGKFGELARIEGVDVGIVGIGVVGSVIVVGMEGHGN
jgi:hypothetical protein